ncbi:MAG TPA: 3-hydroxyacyl-ACP dehydratase FabZ family protein [Phycisphaerae bacterium]|nr:3-hydroxyacyl-ACP dehydratase FabZ family protein [Phycisphaerae bacterium]
MPPPLLFDLSDIDLSRAIISREQIYQALPHRHEFSLLDGVVYLDRDAGHIVTLKHIRQDDWWTRGHIPDRPLFPGVLMIEAAAQTASYFTHTVSDQDRFFGFGGVDAVKFREAVMPTCTLHLLGQAIDIRPRRMIFQIQALVGNTMVFEGKITGMPV